MIYILSSKKTTTLINKKLIMLFAISLFWPTIEKMVKHPSPHQPTKLTLARDQYTRRHVGMRHGLFLLRASLSWAF